jgi:hypothetical protein
MELTIVGVEVTIVGFLEVGICVGVFVGDIYAVIVTYPSPFVFAPWVLLRSVPEVQLEPPAPEHTTPPPPP